MSLNGRPAGKSSSAALGDEVYAEGLGRFTVLEVQGETRKGNVKVVLRCRAELTAPLQAL